MAFPGSQTRQSPGDRSPNHVSRIFWNIHLSTRGGFPNIDTIDTWAGYLLWEPPCVALPWPLPTMAGAATPPRGDHTANHPLFPHGAVMGCRLRQGHRLGEPDLPAVAVARSRTPAQDPVGRPPAAFWGVLFSLFLKQALLGLRRGPGFGGAQWGRPLGSGANPQVPVGSEPSVMGPGRGGLRNRLRRTQIVGVQLSLLGTTLTSFLTFPPPALSPGHLPQSWAGPPRSYYKSEAKAASHCARLSADPLPSVPQNPEWGLTLPLPRGGPPRTHWSLCSALSHPGGLPMAQL